MASIKLKHSGGNGTIIAAPTSNPASDKTLTLPSDVDGTIVSKDSSNSLQNITGINGGQLGNRNLIINGAMQVAQRGTSSTTSGYSTVDRFQVIKGGVDENPTQAQVDVASGTTPYNLGFTKALKVTNGNQTSGAGATDYIEIGHKIEAQNIRNSGWNYLSSSSFITLTFYVKSSVAQVFYGYLTTRDGTRQSYPFSTGSLSADTWTKVTKTIPGNSNLTFDNDNGSGLEVLIDPFYGTNYTNNSRSLDSWAAHANGSHFPDMTSTWYTTNDSTFEITGVQLEVGSVATDFEHRSFGQELALCQRYFCAYGSPIDGISNGSRLGSGISTSSNNAIITIPTGTKMRANPSGSFSSGVTINDAVAGPDASSVSTTVAYNGHAQVTFVTAASTLTAGNAAHIRFESTSYLHLSAEL